MFEVARGTKRPASMLDEADGFNIHVCDEVDGEWHISKLNNSVARPQETYTNIQGQVSIESFMSQRLHQQPTPESDSESEEESSSDEEDIVNAESAKAGVIEKITLKNFMCHDFFELDLGPQINFIIGSNGSGKSAILTGISVGLGAKATDTNRGSSIKDMIKDGKTTARTTIVFLNEGPQAYKPNEYGNRIIVERKLQRHGTNSYALKSSTGKVISTKKGVLDEILHKFNITIDNPLAFLSQDKAREFITSSSDSTKYEYFMEGAYIAEIFRNFQKTVSNVQNVDNKLKQIKKQAVAFRRKYEEAKLVYDRYRESDYLRRKLQVIHGKIYWFNVYTIEQKVKSYEKKLIDAQNEAKSIKERIQEMIDKGARSQAERETLKEEFEGIQSEVVKCKDHYNELVTAHTDVKTRMSTTANEIRSRTEEAKSHKERIKVAEKEIESELRRIDELNGQSKDALRQALEELHMNEEKLKSDKQTAKDELAQLENSKIPKLAEIDAEISQTNQSINSLEKRKQALLVSQKDKYAAWGREMTSILNEIKSYHGWHKLPIGPIGSFIEVEQEYAAWKPLMNTVLGKTLDSFLVCDEHDRKTLANIFRKYRINKNVIVRKFEVFNYDRGKVKDQTTFLDMIKTSNDNVLYTLVDANTIEKFVIAKNYMQADDLVRQNIPNLLGVFSLHQKNSGQRTSMTNGTLRIDPVYYSNDLSKFSVGSISNARELEELNTQLVEERENLERLARTRRSIMSSRSSLLETCRAKLANISQSLDLTTKEIRKVEIKINENGDFAKIESLKTEIEDLNTQIKTLENVKTSLIQDYKQKIEKMESLKSEANKAESELKDVQSRNDELQNRIMNLEFEISEMDSNVQSDNSELERKGVIIGECEQKLQLANAKLREVVEIAESKCNKEEVSITEIDSQHSIQKEYEEIQRQVRQAEESVGRPLAEVQLELAQAKEKRDITNRTIEELSRASGDTNSALNVRFNTFHTTFLHNVQDACRLFENALELRGFKGSLTFDYENKKLIMLAKTRNDDQPRTMDSLSGGEKSFAQIALLLSIWKVMNSRVRGLDEFDVFMDSVNRSISIKLLLHELRQYPKSQSIFITPQDIAVVGDLDNDDVKIHKMPDARKET